MKTKILEDNWLEFINWIRQQPVHAEQITPNEDNFWRWYIDVRIGDTQYD